MPYIKNMFAFSAGEEIGTHDSKGDAMVQVIEGEGRFVVDGKPHICQTDDADVKRPPFILRDFNAGKIQGNGI